MINRILIVGLGNIGKRHLRLARGLYPSANIKVLRHQQSVDVPEYSNGCLHGLEDALMFAPQLAVIASPAPFHIAVAQTFAENGIHLLIEKPLSSSLDGVVKLLQTCEQHNIVLLTGYNLRFMPSLQQFRSLIIDRVIGKVLSVRCEIGQYLPSWRSPEDYRKSVSAKEELGGGALLELSHELDYLRWIFGEVKWVLANLSRQSELEIDVEDTAHLILGFELDQDECQLIGSVNVDFIRHDFTRSCVAIGDKGSLLWNGLTGDVSILLEGETEWQVFSRSDSRRDDSYVAEWKHLIACIEESEPPFITGFDAFKVLKIIEGARRSSEIGAKQHIVQTKTLSDKLT